MVWLWKLSWCTMTKKSATTLDQLGKPVSDIPGIGSRRAALLARLDIHTWYDLLTYFPRDYESWLDIKPVSALQHLETEVFYAQVHAKPLLQRKGRLSIIRAVLTQDGYAIKAIWFNQPWLQDKLKPGETYLFRGKIKRTDRYFSVENPVFQAGTNDSEHVGQGLKPIYPLTRGLTQAMLRQMILSLLPDVIDLIPEPLPAFIRRNCHLCAAGFAYSRVHQPADWQEAEVCRKRLAFEELFLFQTGLYLLRKGSQRKGRAISVALNQTATVQLEQVEKALPFTLTQAQKKAWQAIVRDLTKTVPMNRLLQGDVGSGKTVVAALAMLQSALAGCQSVLMAPTEVLARQHAQTLQKLLVNSGVEITLLTGSTKAAERKTILAHLADGSLKILVGTHAVIEQSVRFNRLALAITDEQHRFGVRQRIRLAAQEESTQPHVLVMSATPIPRTLALMLYGDLDLSVIDQLPAGRKPIQTYTARQKDRDRVNALIEKFVGSKQQVYVICPMIEADDTMDMESAEGVWQRLQTQLPQSISTGLLHGQMKANAKNKIMDDFLSGDIDVLVSTTVVEVGVDNPHASLMIIENAERFGLAQLHQLRGRIGRGSQASLCILMSETDSDLARERLRALCHSQNGFELAEKDLQLRGPGDFFGTRQHGLPPLRVANLYEDTDLLQQSREQLTALTRLDPQLEKPQHQIIRKTLQTRYGDVFSQIGI